MRRIALLAVLTCGLAAHAQWQMQASGTTASLRGIHSVGKGIAWASGTNGTVMRTEDGGYLWQKCVVPPGAEKLDFRGVQGFDENTAIVMSSGKGDTSRLYRTTDGCQTWKLIFQNPDKEGFWDFVRGQSTGGGKIETVLIGDPVDNAFSIYRSMTGAGDFQKMPIEGLASVADEGLFAASNTSADIDGAHGIMVFGTGGPNGARLLRICFTCKPRRLWQPAALEGFVSGNGAGIFSVAHHGSVWVAVGGDYMHPNEHRNNAAYSTDSGATWKLATSFPSGYRSAVAYDQRRKAWITVGPNGTDASFDDGKTWKPLKPAANEAGDLDRNWNAISLPFVVGPKGRIAVLKQDALKSK